MHSFQQSEKKAEKMERTNIGGSRMTELKPCPFCGSKIKTYRAEYIGECCERLEVTCRFCNTSFDISIPERLYCGNQVFLEGDAIARWNSRANDERTN